MTQIFHPSMNAFSKATIFGGAFILAGIAWAGGLWFRSPYVTQEDVVRDQPAPFSHDHHVSGLGIDCRYCHTSVEDSSFAGIPATEICMGCHSQIWKDSPMLEPVRESYRTNRPLQWTRVHNLPDYVYFDHSIHVAKGIGCESCHGRVDRMPLMRKAHGMQMEWCLECHRHPETRVREKGDIFRFGIDQPLMAGTEYSASVESESAAGESGGGGEAHASETASEARRAGEELVAAYNINASQLTNCAICHR